MPSNVNPFNINGNYPIAGQDNDSQGFRDNFTNIKNNFAFIKSEVEDIQNKALLKSALIGTTINNDMLGQQLINIQLKNITETIFDWGTTAGEFDLDISDGNLQKIDTFGSITIGQILNWPGNLQFAKMLVYLTVNSASHTFELPSGITTDLTALPGFRNNVITFADAPGSYILEFSSPDSGLTIFVRELTRGNPNFRDPNFYLSAVTTNPTLRVGFGNLFATSVALDSYKGGADTLSIKGPMTSYNTHQSGGNFANNQVAGYSVAKSRATDPGAGNAITEVILNDGDYVGYVNAYGYTVNRDQITYDYNELGQIGFFSVSTNPDGTAGNSSTGGNIVISTRPPGGTVDGLLLPAVVIDNRQSMTVYGNLTVLGNSTFFNTETVTVEDKNIVLGTGAGTTALLDGGGITIGNATVANAQITYSNTHDGWVFNKNVHISNSAVSTNASTGALVVAGGLGIGGALNVGGAFGLTSTEESIGVSTGSFQLGGGVYIAKNIITAGNIYANASTRAQQALGANARGALSITTGGAYIGGNLVVGGDGTSTNRGGIFSLSTLEATSATSDASIKSLGSMAVAQKVYIGGHLTTSNTANATSHTHASFKANGGIAVQGTSWFLSPNNNDFVKIGSGTTAFGNAAGGTTGALQVGIPGSTLYGGISTAGNLVVGDGSLGNIYARATTTSINSTTGALQVFGGIGVQGNINVGGGGVGNIYAASGAVTNQFNRGALVVDGGMGVSGNAVVQGNVITQGGRYDRSANVAIPVTTGNIILDNSKHTTVVAPGGTIAALTITMPDAFDGTDIRISFASTVTTLTMTPKAGDTIVGALTTATAGAFAQFLYVSNTLTWYRVG